MDDKNGWDTEGGFVRRCLEPGGFRQCHDPLRSADTAELALAREDESNHLKTPPRIRG